MFLAARSFLLDPGSFPHTRGDVPARRKLAEWCEGFPHTRGDVPTYSYFDVPTVLFSPHTWGCSVRRTPDRDSATVFPTHVGMFRRGRGTTTARSCFPHTRGDVPGFSNGFQDRQRVFPTHVGMFRSANELQHSDMRFPHTRGDVPWLVVGCESGPKFSPHTWGCSAAARARPSASTVFPTHVGMFRIIDGDDGSSRGFPHTRGDVPYACRSGRRGGVFSPHTWGCSGQAVGPFPRVAVFPTHVGMFRPGGGAR